MDIDFSASRRGQGICALTKKTCRGYYFKFKDGLGERFMSMKGFDMYLGFLLDGQSPEPDSKVAKPETKPQTNGAAT